MLPLLVAVSCGERQPEVLKSQPVGAPEQGRVGSVKDDVLRPDGRKPLTVGMVTSLDVPGFEALEGEPREVALSVCNGTTAPCPTCMDEGRALSACLDVPGCGNVPQLVELVVRLAGEGAGFLEVQERVEWEDPWFDIVQDGLPIRGEGRVVTVVVDYESPFSRDAELVLRELEAQVVLLPWWGEDRELAPVAAAAMASADDPWALHAALLAEPLTPERLEALIGEHGVELEAGREEALRRRELAESMGVRGTPTVFIGGYRVRGLRTADFYQSRLADLP